MKYKIVVVCMLLLLGLLWNAGGVSAGIDPCGNTTFSAVSVTGQAIVPSQLVGCEVEVQLVEPAGVDPNGDNTGIPCIGYFCSICPGSLASLGDWGLIGLASALPLLGLIRMRGRKDEG